MTLSNTAVSLREAQALAVVDTKKTPIAPPSFHHLPRRAWNWGLFPSTLLHLAAMVGVIWLPPLFPDSAKVVENQLSKPEVAEAVPLVLPKLPPLESRGTGIQPSSLKAPDRAAAASMLHPAEPQLEEPDYVNAQEIVSLSPHPVNRVQTIVRPDLVSPPEMKFPLRLQSMVSLPAVTPVLKPTPREVPKQPPMPVAQETSEEIPVPKPVPSVVTLTPKRASIARPKAATAPTVAPNLKAFAKVQGNALKAIVVVNAVNVEPDPSVPIPDAQLAGLFVVGPAPDPSAASKSLAGGTSRSPADASSPSGKGDSIAPAGENNKSSSTGAGANGSGNGALASVGIGTPTGNGAGTGLAPTPATGNGAGSGPSGATGSGAGIGAVGHGAGTSTPGGITISGGVTARGNASISRAGPSNRAYGMMVISGGNNGGASRDLGVFGRSETVYSVTIQMVGGPDWTMQYALLSPAQAGAGLLVPPVAAKKVGAVVTKSQSQSFSDSGPVFVAGTIDESGKTQALRCVRAQDARCQPAIRALEQWEFQPAQLDGKPVASKVLIGVAITIAAE